jgi:hypothetical protein
LTISRIFFKLFLSVASDTTKSWVRAIPENGKGRGENVEQQTGYNHPTDRGGKTETKPTGKILSCNLS